jgi:hypothetical protein
MKVIFFQYARPCNLADKVLRNNRRKCLIKDFGCSINISFFYKRSRPVFLNRRAAARYRAMASIILGREKFSWKLSF